jgi:hypothetical protein
MTIKFIHLRRRDPFWGFLEPTGGVTVAYDIDDTGLVTYTDAKCSDKDHYCKAIGRAISSGRLKKGNTPEVHVVSSFPKVEGVNIVEQIINHHDEHPK